MPRNTGKRPDTDALIDIRFRNGKVERDTTADKWRWAQWPWGESDWDITHWQMSE